MASVDVEGATISGKSKQKTNVFWRTVPQNEQFRNVLVPGVASGVLKGSNNDSKLQLQGETIRKSKSDSAVPSRRDNFLTLEKGARRTTKTARKIPEKDSSVKNTNVLKETGRVGSIMNLSGSESSRRSSIKNLNVEDKKRVANLIKELAKTGEERELALERLQEERVSFEGRLSAVQEEQASLRLERESLRQKLEKGQELLKKYETELKNIKLQKEKQDKILKKQSVAMAQGTQTSPLQRADQGTESKSVRAPQVPIYSNSLFDLKMSKVEEPNFFKPEDGVEVRRHDQSSKRDSAGLHELYLREYKLQLRLQEQQLEIQRQQVLLQQHLQVLQQQQQQQQQQEQPRQVQQQQQQQEQSHQQQQQQQHEQQEQHEQQQQQQHEQQQQHHHHHELQRTPETSAQQTDTPQQRPNHKTEYMKTQERLPDHHSQEQSERNRLQHSAMEHELHQRSDKIQHGSHYNHLNNQPRKHLSHSPQAMDGLPSQHHHRGAKHGNSLQPVSQRTKTFERTRQYNSIGHNDVTDVHHKSFEKHGHLRKPSTDQQPVEQHQSTEVYHARPHTHIIEHHYHSPEQYHHSMEKRGAREKHHHSNLDPPYQPEPHSPQTDQGHPEYYGHLEQNGSRRNHYHQTDDHHFNAEHLPPKPYGPQSENPVEPFSNKDYCQECLGNSKFLGEQHYAYSEHSCYIKQNHSPSEQQFFVAEQPKTVGEPYHHVAEPRTLHPSRHHPGSAYHNTSRHDLMREQPFEPMTQYSGQINSSHHQLPENRDHLKHGQRTDVLANSSGHVHQTRQIHSHSNHDSKPRQPQTNNGYSDTQASLDEYISNHHHPTEYDHHNHAGYALYKPAIPQRSHERPHSRQKPSSAPNYSHGPYSQSPSNNYPHSLIEIVENLESNSEYEETFSDSHLTSEVVSVSSDEENQVLDNIFFLKR